MRIPFNKPYLTGKETHYIYDAVYSGKLSGNGIYTKKCQSFFEERYKFSKCLLTTSCTDALEMAAILLNIQPGDEVILPSFTFVSTANAFELRGARLIFADSRNDHPGIDEYNLENLITEKTKAIVVVHYAGVACDMDYIIDIAKKYKISIVEDAAQALDSFYKGKPLGGFGDVATFSFHETKNIISGEGGMLVVNNPELIERAEIIWEKGTNRSAFFRGEVDKYNWVDIGSSFLPSEVTAAFLWAQLEELDKIQQQRRKIWETYNNELKQLQTDLFITPKIPQYSTNNAHMFYIILRGIEERNMLMKKLKKHGILAVFHYQSLHMSPYYKDKYSGPELTYCIRYTNCLLRLPFFYNLKENEQSSIIEVIKKFASHMSSMG